MSWEATAYVAGLKCGKSEASRSEKLVMFSLANRYNSDEGMAWPTQALLAEETGFSRRGLKYVLARLEEKRLIERVRGDGRGHSSTYRFPGMPGVKGAAIAPFPEERVHGRSDKGCTGVPIKGALARRIKKNRNRTVSRTETDNLNFSEIEAKEDWQKISEELKANLNVQSWETWIKPLRAYRIEDEKLVVGVPTEEFAQWIRANWASWIKAAARKLGLRWRGLHFEAKRD